MRIETKSKPYSRNEVRNSVLVWLDLLGFSNMVCKSSKSELNYLVSRLTTVLGTAKQHVLDALAADGIVDPAWVTKSFSDNIILAYPIVNTNHFEFSHSIYMTGHYQMEMVLSGYFVRGAIAIGDTFVNDETIISKAMLEAYEDETHRARVPRIILSNSAKAIVDDIIINKSDENNKLILADLVEGLLVDGDGQYFINYLEIVYRNSMDAFSIEKHRSAIEGQLIRFSNADSLVVKYAWLASFHNYFCSRYPEFDSYKINVHCAPICNFYQINRDFR